MVPQCRAVQHPRQAHRVALLLGLRLRSAVLGRVLAIIALLALNGFFVAAEFSIVRSRRSRLEAMARGGDTKARLVLRATASLARLLSASQFGITLASIGIGALAEETLSAFFARPRSGRVGW